MKCKRCEMDCPGFRHADIRVCIELLMAKVRELTAELAKVKEGKKKNAVL